MATAPTDSGIEPTIDTPPPRTEGGDLRELALEYHTRGLFGPRHLAAYDQALKQHPSCAPAAEGAGMCIFLKMLRRFTVECHESDEIDQQGVRDAIEVIKEHLKRHSTSPDLFAVLGDLHLVRGNPLLAIGAYENALRRGFSDHWAILRAFEFCSAIQRLQPSERAYFARLYCVVGLSEKARELLRVIVAEGYHDRAVIASLVELIEQAMLAESNQNVLNAGYMEVSELYLAAGETERALDAFRRVHFPVNQNFQFVKKVSSILIARGEFRQAFDYLSQIPVDEENKELINRITVELEKAGDLDTAVRLLQFINDNDLVIREAQSLREKEIEIQAEMVLAELNQNNRRYDFAMTSFVRVLKLGYADDLVVLSKIVELLPLVRNDHTDELHFIGDLYLERHDYYRASQFYDLILDRRPDDQRACDKLRRIYTSIFSKNPDLPELRIRSGDLYQRAGDLESAIAEFKLAAQFPETNLEATRRLAIIHIRRNETTLAFEAYQQISPSDIDLENLYQLHLMFASQDRPSEALSLLNMVAAVDQEYRDVQDRLDQYGRQAAAQAERLPVDEKMRELIGDIAVGRYQYMEKLGSGGMGVVHKVYDLKLDRPVAMKILREGLASSNKAVERFFREARIAATLNHPHIVNIYDYNINQQTHQSYISMEFVDGPSLRDMFEDYLVEGTPLTRERIIEAVYYCAQVCDALQVTHSKGIIHRDIKPDNILVNTGRMAKLTDFGIVHVEEATFTPTGAVIGTPRYMSPEQVRGTRLDGRADLYSVGIIVYEWLLGSPPFITGDIAYQQVNVRPVPPAEQDPAIPLDLSDAIMKCLEKPPEDRYQSASDLKAALDDIVRRHAPSDSPFAVPLSSHHTPIAPVIEAAPGAPDDLDIDTI